MVQTVPYSHESNLLITLFVISWSEFDVAKVNGDKWDEKEQAFHCCIVNRNETGEQIQISSCENHEE